MLRSKGYFWLATRMDFAGSWSQAGGACRHSAAGLWWTVVDPEQWPDDPDYRQRIIDKSENPFGDRRQELVFIGMEMDQAVIQANLDACLLTDKEMSGGENTWRRMPDPFPVWAAIADADVETELSSA